MAGFLGNLFGLGGNNGTENAFKNSGSGGQDFKKGEFNTGVEVARGRYAPCNRNNGTKDAFNNSGSGKQNFGSAKFNTGARSGFKPSLDIAISLKITLDDKKLDKVASAMDAVT
ncbi:hypothetical protein V8G54_001932 [Vigna mungo]|uniref:Uncharacterized protein n=1 Tax=Vigna mungo TaxID=3915 RepID=A0AAQ3SBD8_VIGMU